MPLDFGTRGNLVRVIRGPQGETGEDGDAISSDNVFSSTWDGATVVPTQNAVYDKINQMETAATITGGSISGVDITASTYTGLISNSTITGGNITGSTLDDVVLSDYRTQSTATYTLYVSTAGSDTTGTGLTTASQFATIQRAINKIANDHDLRGNAGTVVVAPGTYSGIFLNTVPGGPNGGNVSIVGSTSNPTLTVINGGSSSAIRALGAGTDWMVKGFSVSCTAGTAVRAHAGSWVRISDMRFTGAQSALMGSDYGGTLEIEGGTVTIAGDAIYAIWTQAWGKFLAFGCTINTTGARAFTEFVHCEHKSDAAFPSVTITTGGALTGTRFGVEQNSAITEVNNNPNFFPGSSAGYIRSGGVYDDLYRETILWKTSNEIRATTGLTGDAQLVTVLSSAATYKMAGDIYFNSETTANFEYTLSGTTAGYYDVRITEVAPGSTAPNFRTETAPSFGPRVITNATTSGGQGHISFDGIVQSSGASGFYQFFWRPSTTLNAELKAGSNIRLTRIA
jgi:hypothetical protein